MSCTRAFELDLAAFLRDPRAAEWDDFRAHYPRCADCAAEVAAWTAVEALLRSPQGEHPEPEELLRWSDAPDSLAAERRVELARHLDACPPCRDELRALAGFALPASDAAASARPEPAVGSPRGEHAARREASAATAAARAEGPARVAAATRPGTVEHGVRSRGRRGTADRPHREPGRRRGWSTVPRVLWHPAVAYALLLAVVLAPAFRARFAEVGGARVATPGTLPAPTTASRGPDAAPPRPREVPEPAAPARYRAAPDELRRASPAERAKGSPALRAERAGEQAAPSLARQAPVPVRPGGDAATLADEAGEREADTASAVSLAPPDAHGMRRLTVAVPPGAAPADILEVSIRDAAGARELRERAEIPAGGGEISLDVPAAWLDAPTFLVELRARGRVLARHALATR